MRGAGSPPSPCWPHFLLCVTGYIWVFLGHKHAVLTHIQYFIHQYPQALLRRAGLNLLMPQFVSMFGIPPTQVQDIAHGLVELHGTHTGPPL